MCTPLHLFFLSLSIPSSLFVFDVWSCQASFSCCIELLSAVICQIVISSEMLGKRNPGLNLHVALNSLSPCVLKPRSTVSHHVSSLPLETTCVHILLMRYLPSQTSTTSPLLPSISLTLLSPPSPLLSSALPLLAPSFTLLFLFLFAFPPLPPVPDPPSSPVA